MHQTKKRCLPVNFYEHYLALAVALAFALAFALAVVVCESEIVLASIALTDFDITKIGNRNVAQKEFDRKLLEQRNSIAECMHTAH